MSNTLINNVSREKIQSLLVKAVGSKPVEDTTQTDATEYNWLQPHYFSLEQLSRLEALTKKTAAVIAEKFTALYNNDFNVTVASTEQRFAGELLNQPSDEVNDYYLPFGLESERPCGFISIPLQTALVWVTQLLGNPDTEKDSSRNLSKLEESLLSDIASVVVEALSTSIGNFNVQANAGIVTGQLPLELQGSEEFLEIIFSIAKAGEEDSDKAGQAHILILCSKLDSAIEKTTQADKEFSKDDISKAILEHLQQMPVSVTAQLGSTVLGFEEIMSLSINDILLLDKRIDEPVELIVEDETFFLGRPAKSTGKYAVVITATSFSNKTQKAKPRPSSKTAKNINPI